MQQLNVGEAQNGSNETLYDRFASMLFPYLYAQTASIQDAEDLLLEVFIAAFRNDKLTGLPDEQKLAWLRRVARNKVIDRYRHASLLTTLPLEQVMEQEDDALTPEQRAEQQERYERLYEVLKQLSPLQQEIIQLRFVDIAAFLAKPEAYQCLFARTIKQYHLIAPAGVKSLHQCPRCCSFPATLSVYYKLQRLPRLWEYSKW